MSDQKHNVPKKLSLGKRKGSGEAEVPTASGAGGNIMTNFQEISWTKRKLILTIVALATPYLAVLIASFMAGYILMGIIFGGIGVFVVVMYLLLRFLERADL